MIRDRSGFKFFAHRVDYYSRLNYHNHSTFCFHNIFISKCCYLHKKAPIQPIAISKIDQWQIWSRDLQEWASLNYVSKVFSRDLHWRPVGSPIAAHFCHCNSFLDAYRFRIGIKDFQTANQQRATVELIRDIADKPAYADLNTVFISPV